LGGSFVTLRQVFAGQAKAIAIVSKARANWLDRIVFPVAWVALAIIRPDLINRYSAIGFKIVAAFFAKLELVIVFIALFIAAIWTFNYLDHDFFLTDSFQYFLR
jgi:hypothetical protein